MTKRKTLAKLADLVGNAGRAGRRAGWRSSAGGIVRTRRCLSAQGSFSRLVSRPASAASSMPSYSPAASRTSIAAAVRSARPGTRSPCAAARGRPRRSPARTSQPVPRQPSTPEREVLSGDDNVRGGSAGSGASTTSSVHRSSTLASASASGGRAVLPFSRGRILAGGVDSRAVVSSNLQVTSYWRHSGDDNP